MRLPASCIKPLGVSRTDLFFDEKWAENCRTDFYRQYPEACGKKIVLWAPTFRGNAGRPELIRLDLWKLQAALGEDYLVLAKLHPHMYASAGLSEKQLSFLCPIPTEQLYPVADILIAVDERVGVEVDDVHMGLLSGGEIAIHKCSDAY